MTEATYKDYAIDAALSAITGKDRVETVADNRCVTCDTVDPVEFRDDLSRREYTISGMCQMCQDKVFGRVPEDYWDSLGYGA